ncbi:MAG: hypothetical protein WCL60_17270 [Methylococcales bacterium]|jgi:hypothetical protein
MMNTDRQEILTADEIAEKAMSGEDISLYFTNKGKMNPAVHKIQLEISSDMLQELDAFATELNVSRQAVIKIYLRQSLDNHYLARDRQRQQN